VQLYCAHGTSGPLCRTCKDSRHHYVLSKASCAACPEHSRAIVSTCATIVGGSALFSLLAMMLVRCLWRWHGRLRAFSVRHALSPKMKILISFYQVAAAVPRVCDVALPEWYHKATRFLDLMSCLDLIPRPDWLPSIIVPHECLGGFGTRLALVITLPIAVLVLNMGITAFTVALYHRSGMSMAALRDGAVYAVSLGLFLLFCLVPSVSLEIFSTFAWRVCEARTTACARMCSHVCSLSAVRSDGFGYDATTVHFYLHTDLRMRCYEAEHSRVRLIAAAGIALWPVGVPLLFFFLLRTASSAKVRTSTSQVDFLHSDYKCVRPAACRGLFTCWWV
jgi:hypothetical protein